MRAAGFGMSSTRVGSGAQTMSRKTAAVLADVLGLAGSPRRADAAQPFVYLNAVGRLAYAADSRGNRIPDFSHAGYAGGAVIPDVPVKVVVPPGPGDNGPRI